MKNQNWSIVINGEEKKYFQIIDRSDINETHLEIGHYRPTDWVADAKIRIEGNYKEFLTTLTRKLLELTNAKEQ